MKEKNKICKGDQEWKLNLPIPVKLIRPRMG